MKNKSTFFIFALLTFSILPNFISADLGPKPSVDFNIYYNNQSISGIFYSGMLNCDYTFGKEQLMNDIQLSQIDGELTHEQKEEICESNPSRYNLGKTICWNLIGNLEQYERKRLEYLQKEGYHEIWSLNVSDQNKGCYWRNSLWAWGGECQDSECHFGYDPPSEFKLAVYIPSLDKVFISNEISRTNFNSNYEVFLNSDGSAKISETTSLFRTENVSSFIKALLTTLIIELLVALIYLSSTKLPKKIIISVLVGSLITLPIAWFVFPLIKIVPLVILSSEIFAIVFEAYFIYYLNKQAITLKKSFVLSAIMNLASLIIGGFISLVLLFVFI